MKKLFSLLVAFVLLHVCGVAQKESSAKPNAYSTAEWQWSVAVDSVISGETNDHPRAFLWIPPNCKRVRGVVVGQHNMIEEGIFEHATFRKTMGDLGFAIVWVSPNFTINFDFNNKAGEYFEGMMRKLADSSGYEELALAPIIPIGHSAMATYPWNFAAWNPARTLAAISVHGDAPQTRLTGYGRPNIDWGNRTIEGVPGLFVMGEYEWWEKRIEPGFDYVTKHPGTPITFFADAGHGHFDYSDELIAYISLFIQKVAGYRLPKEKDGDLNAHVTLTPIDPSKGWLMDRWHKDSLPTAQPAPYSKYKGNIGTASWAFDEEMAKATEAYYANARGKERQYIGLVQEGKVVNPSASHANYSLPFIPAADGMTFHVRAFFSDTSRLIATDRHAVTPLYINRICGPVAKVDDSTFRLRFYRMGFNNPKRSSDFWLLAMNKGDARYKSIVQQMDIHFPLTNKEGKPQQIDFPAMDNQKEGAESLALQATSSAGVPVYYYVREGPAYIDGQKLVFTHIPPRTRFPVKVTVVAWQYGTALSPRLQSATPVERSFFIEK